ncbi:MULTISPECIES: methyltransferase domain-containing protein [Cellulomonas]|uniref:methyltransferase domain-containing protein n=1 Tax=Cellulomonas TaxID=1707 RepID=UPI0010A7A38D|nr:MULTISPECIES: methyltransferase domain-containing protein [Cellulomonas]
MLVSSRSAEEYRAFFALTDDDLAGRVLDCSAGASGFTAALGAAGADVTAVDPTYVDRDALRDEVARSAAAGVALVDAHDDRFTWSWYGSPARRRELREAALAAFLDDLDARPDRYVVGALPDLPFEDDAFDLALCSHLLFTWAGSFDAEWHHAALTELLRVADEVRVYPLVHLGAGEPVAFLPALLDRLRSEGRTVRLVPVAYEFQVGATQMLVVRR